MRAGTTIFFVILCGILAAGCGCGGGKTHGGGGCGADGRCNADCAAEDPDCGASTVPGFHAAAGTVANDHYRLTGTLSHVAWGTPLANETGSIVGRVTVPGGAR